MEKTMKTTVSGSGNGEGHGNNLGLKVWGL